MGGMKKRLTSAKTARDPDSRINKALRKWNCEESFNNKLAALREERQVNEFVLPLVQGAARLALGAAAGEALYQGAKQAVKAGARGLSKLTSKVKAPTKAPTKAPKTPSKLGTAAAAGTGAAVGSSAGSAASAPEDPFSSATKALGTGLIGSKTGTKSKSSREFAPYRSLTPTQQSRYTANILAKENKISEIQNMINEGVDNMNLSINGRTVTLNNSMAKKIIRVYESVNNKNKKIVENMLNEDLDSFKKLLNFSIKA
jgi:hypothetical protein